LSKCTGCIEENSISSSGEDRVTEDSGELCQEGIELVQVCTEGTLFEFREKRSVKEETLTGLLNTLQAQQGVLEQEVARGHLHPFKERKGQRQRRGLVETRVTSVRWGPRG
jgi:hypothetical protein